MQKNITAVAAVSGADVYRWAWDWTANLPQSQSQQPPSTIHFLLVTTQNSSILIHLNLYVNKGEDDENQTEL